LNDVNVVRVYWANALEPAVATNSENSVALGVLTRNS